MIKSNNNEKDIFEQIEEINGIIGSKEDYYRKIQSIIDIIETCCSGLNVKDDETDKTDNDVKADETDETYNIIGEYAPICSSQLPNKSLDINIDSFFVKPPEKGCKVVPGNVRKFYSKLYNMSLKGMFRDQFTEDEKLILKKKTLYDCSELMDKLTYQYEDFLINLFKTDKKHFSFENKGKTLKVNKDYFTNKKTVQGVVLGPLSECCSPNSPIYFSVQQLLNKDFSKEFLDSIKRHLLIVTNEKFAQQLRNSNATYTVTPIIEGMLKILYRERGTIKNTKLNGEHMKALQKKISEYLKSLQEEIDNAKISDVPNIDDQLFNNPQRNNYERLKEDKKKLKTSLEIIKQALKDIKTLQNNFNANYNNIVEKLQTTFQIIKFKEQLKNYNNSLASFTKSFREAWKKEIQQKIYSKTKHIEAKQVIGEYEKYNEITFNEKKDDYEKLKIEQNDNNTIISKAQTWLKNSENEALDVFCINLTTYKNNLDNFKDVDLKKAHPDQYDELEKYFKYGTEFVKNTIEADEGVKAKVEELLKLFNGKTNGANFDIDEKTKETIEKNLKNIKSKIADKAKLLTNTCKTAFDDYDNICNGQAASVKKFYDDYKNTKDYCQNLTEATKDAEKEIESLKKQAEKALNKSKETIDEYTKKIENYKKLADIHYEIYKTNKHFPTSNKTGLLGLVGKNPYEDFKKNINSVWQLIKTNKDLEKTCQNADDLMKDIAEQFKADIIEYNDNIKKINEQQKNGKKEFNDKLEKIIETNTKIQNSHTENNKIKDDIDKTVNNINNQLQEIEYIKAQIKETVSNKAAIQVPEGVDALIQQSTEIAKSSNKIVEDSKETVENARFTTLREIDTKELKKDPITQKKSIDDLNKMVEENLEALKIGKKNTEDTITTTNKKLDDNQKTLNDNLTQITKIKEHLNKILEQQQTEKDNKDKDINSLKNNLNTSNEGKKKALLEKIKQTKEYNKSKTLEDVYNKLQDIHKDNNNLVKGEDGINNKIDAYKNLLNENKNLLQQLQTELDKSDELNENNDIKISDSETKSVEDIKQEAITLFTNSQKISTKATTDYTNLQTKETELNTKINEFDNKFTAYNLDTNNNKETRDKISNDLKPVEDAKTNYETSYTDLQTYLKNQLNNEGKYTSETNEEKQNIVGINQRLKDILNAIKVANEKKEKEKEDLEKDVKKKFNSFKTNINDLIKEQTKAIGENGEFDTKLTKIESTNNEIQKVHKENVDVEKDIENVVDGINKQQEYIVALVKQLNNENDLKIDGGNTIITEKLDEVKLLIAKSTNISTTSNDIVKASKEDVKTAKDTIKTNEYKIIDGAIKYNEGNNEITVTEDDFKKYAIKYIAEFDKRKQAIATTITDTNTKLNGYQQQLDNNLKRINEIKKKLEEMLTSKNNERVDNDKQIKNLQYQLNEKEEQNKNELLEKIKQTKEYNKSKTLEDNYNKLQDIHKENGKLLNDTDNGLITKLNTYNTLVETNKNLLQQLSAELDKLEELNANVNNTDIQINNNETKSVEDIRQEAITLFTNSQKISTKATTDYTNLQNKEGILKKTIETFDKTKFKEELDKNNSKETRKKIGEDLKPVEDAKKTYEVSYTDLQTYLTNQLDKTGKYLSSETHNETQNIVGINQRLKDVLNAIKVANEKKEKEKEDLENRLGEKKDKAKNKNEDLKKELAGLGGGGDELKNILDSINDTNKQIQDTHNDNNEISKDIENNNSEIEKIVAENQRLATLINETIEEDEKKIKVSSSNVEETREKLQELMSKSLEISNYSNTQCNIANGVYNTLQDDISKQKTKIDGLLKEADKDVDDANFKEHAKHTAEIEKIIASAKQDIKNTKDKLDKTDKDLKVKLEEILEINSALKDLQAQVQTEKDNKDKENKDLDGSIKNAIRDELDTLKNEITNARNKANNNIENLKKQKESLLEILEKIKQNKNNAEEYLAKIKQIIVEFEKMELDFDVEKNTLDKDENIAQTSVNAIDEIIKKVEERIKKIEEKHVDYTGKLNEIEKYAEEAKNTDNDDRENLKKKLSNIRQKTQEVRDIENIFDENTYEVSGYFKESAKNAQLEELKAKAAYNEAVATLGNANTKASIFKQAIEIKCDSINVAAQATEIYKKYGVASALTAVQKVREVQNYTDAAINELEKGSNLDKANNDVALAKKCLEEAKGFLQNAIQEVEAMGYNNSIYCGGGYQKGGIKEDKKKKTKRKEKPIKNVPEKDKYLQDLLSVHISPNRHGLSLLQKILVFLNYIPGLNIPGFICHMVAHKSLKDYFLAKNETEEERVERYIRQFNNKINKKDLASDIVVAKKHDGQQQLVISNDKKELEFDNAKTRINNKLYNMNSLNNVTKGPVRG